MALIGQIAISMTTDARQFNAGIMQATASLRAFSRLGASLGKVSPFTGIGIGAFTATKGLAQIAGQVRKLVPNLLMLGTGVPREMGFNFGKAFGSIGMGLAKTIGGLGIMAASVARIGINLASSALNAAASAFSAIGSAVMGAVQGLTTFVAIAGVVAGLALFKIIKAASDVAEAMNKTRQEFGEHASIIINEANRMSAAFGISKVATLDAAAAFGSVFRGAGYAAKQSAELAAQFARLTHDTESYYNLAEGGAFDKILGGLTGEIRPLKEIGVLIDDNRVKAQAYAMGLAKAGEEVSQEAKVQARIPLILAGLAKAQGDRARTATDVANAWREVQGRVLSLAEVIGQALEPITKSVLGQMGIAMSALKILWDDNSAAVLAWASNLVGSANKGSKEIGIVQSMIMFAADAWHYFKIAALGAFTSVNDVILRTMKMLEPLVQRLEATKNFITGGIGTEMSTAMHLAVRDVNDLSVAMIGMRDKEKMATLPSLSIAEAFARARAQTEAIRSEVGGLPVVSPDVVHGGIHKADKPKELQLASATLRRESASTILRSKYSGGQTTDELKKVGANTTKANEHLNKIASATDKLAQAVWGGGGVILYDHI